MRITDTLKQEELDSLKIVEFQKDDVLCHEGEPCQGVYVIRQGSVKISSYSLSGQEIVYNLIKEDETFGSNLVFASETKYRGNVIALKNGSAYFISKRRLEELLSQNKEFLLAYMRAMADFGKSLNATIKLLSFSSAEDRLDFYLQTHGGEIVFPSVSQLANELFLSRETLSRLLTKEEKNGRIKRENKKIILIHR